MWYDQFGTSGSYAVVGFFVISGYVITKVLNERYFQINAGIKKFWINRFLRLYPTYWVCALFGVIVAILSPEHTSALGVGIDIPNSESGQARLEKYELSPELWPLFYLNNFAMLGLQSPFLWTSPITFAPTAWSTNVELYFYAILSFIAARSYVNAKRFLYLSSLFIAIIGTIILLHEADYLPYFKISPLMNFRSISLFYYSFLGWSFFFALGTFIYYKRKQAPPAIVKYLVLAACLVMPFYLTKGNPNLFISMRVIYGLLIAYAILIFSDECKNEALKTIGALSYPLFLIHWPMAGLISWLFGYEKNSIEMLLANLPASIIASIIIVQYLEKPIEKIRRRYKTADKTPLK